MTAGRGWSALAAVAMLLLAVGVWAWVALTDSSTRPGQPETVAHSQPSQTAFAQRGYVGWQACGECHGERVRDFQQTRHFHAMEIAAEVPLSQGFAQQAGRQLAATKSVRFDLFAEGRQPVFSATSLAGTTKSEIAYIYGAGSGTDEAFFTWHGNELTELPVAWLGPQQKWGLSLFDPHGDGDFSRPTTPQCLECHTVWVEHQAGTRNQYVRPDPIQLGVTCERCHGPGHDHVQHHQLVRDDKQAYSIVHPGKLSRERQMDLCAQCHSNAVRHRRPPFSYRPGESLEDSFRVLMPEYPEDNRVANQTRYLRESRCFQKSEVMTCITCHDPHHVRQEAERTSGDHSCRACHQPESCRARPTFPAGVQDQCVGCHMPTRNKIQVNFETLDEVVAFPAQRSEHRIGIYPEATREVLYEWFDRQSDAASRQLRDTLAAELHLWYRNAGVAARKDVRLLLAIDSFRHALRYRADEDVRQSLVEAESTYKELNVKWFEGLRLKRERRLHESIEVFEQQLAIHPRLAKVHFELGSIYAAVGDRTKSLSHLRDSIRDDPEEPAPHAMLGWLDFLDGNYSSSVAHYRTAVELESWSDRIQFQLSMGLIKLGEFEEALSRLRQTLTINPQHREAVAAARQLLRERFTAERSLPVAKELNEVTRWRQPALVLTLAEIQFDLGEFGAAQQSLAVARSVKEPDPKLIGPMLSLERRLQQP